MILSINNEENIKQKNCNINNNIQFLKYQSCFNVYNNKNNIVYFCFINNIIGRYKNLSNFYNIFFKSKYNFC